MNNIKKNEIKTVNILLALNTTASFSVYKKKEQKGIEANQASAVAKTWIIITTVITN